MRRIFICLCLLISGVFQLSAQNNPQDEVGAWYILSSNSKVSEKFSVQLQTQLRFYEIASEVQQFKIRTGVTFRVMPGLSLGAGYGYFRNDFSYQSDIPENFDEHRIVEDILLDHSIGKAKVFHRARVENRFIVSNGETEVRHWFRHLAKFTYPAGDHWVFDIYNEVFLNLEEPVFAQNWIGIGATYKINSLIKTRLGFQHIVMEGPNFERVLLELSFSPDFRRKESSKP